MSFLTAAVTIALFLMLPITRLYGVLGVAILLFFRPVLSLAVLALAGITYFTYRKFFA